MSKITEKTRQYRAEYREKHWNDILRKQRAYRAKHKKRLSARNREHYKSRKEQESRIRKRYVQTVGGTVTILYNYIRQRLKIAASKYDPIEKENLRSLLETAMTNMGDMLSLDVNSPTRASIDKIIPTLGYADGNVQIVPQWLNFAYHDFDKAEVDKQIIKYAEYLKSNIRMDDV